MCMQFLIFFCCCINSVPILNENKSTATGGTAAAAAAMKHILILFLYMSCSCVCVYAVQTRKTTTSLVLPLQLYIAPLFECSPQKQHRDIYINVRCAVEWRPRCVHRSHLLFCYDVDAKTIIPCYTHSSCTLLAAYK